MTLRFLSEDVPNNAECALLDCFPLEGCDPLRGAGFSHEGECEQTCHQAGWPVGATRWGTFEKEHPEIVHPFSSTLLGRHEFQLT